MTNAYTTNLDRNPANYAPLTPLTFLKRAQEVFGHRPAYVYGTLSRSWGEVYERCIKFASALNKAGIGKNDTVAILAPNIPEMFEAQFAIAMVGAVVSYTSFIDGEEDLLPGIRNWFGSCLALIIFPYIIRQLAGV